MDSAYRIRVAVPDDLEGIVALERGIDTLPHWSMLDYLAAQSPVGGRLGMEGTTRCTFVAEGKDDCGIVGFAVGKVLATETDVVAELESVGVALAVRRMGIGEELCATVIAWARDMDASAIELEVRSRSAGPIALYERLGFMAEGRRAGYYRDPADDAILMRLELVSKTAPGPIHGRDL